MSGELEGHVGAAQVSRWRVGQYELTTLLDREAWLLRVKEPTLMIHLKLAQVYEEIEAFQAKWETEHGEG